MWVFLGIYLHCLLSAALGHTIPEADQSNFAPDSEGDLLFLVDSSGSVTYDEFANVKEFIGDLLRPFKFGPQDVQASVVQISTDPTLDFPLNQYTSSQDVQKAIQKIRQRMGDTNTGKALDYVKKQLYSEKFGSRPDVPKVLVWVTDGLSTDDISQPMQLLKDMGVTVFIVCTTGRGNFQELSAAASQPDEKYLKFVDKDDLGIITKELRDSIIELIKAKRLHALDITTTGFRLAWPRLLSRDTGHYILEYAPMADSQKKLQMNLPGDHTSVPLTGLTANTTYEVTLYPESNVDYLHPQTIQVSTLEEIIEKRNLEVTNITTTGFRVTWAKLSGDTGSYVLEYSVTYDPRRRSQKALSDETSVVLSNLLPNTSYQVTLIPDSKHLPVQSDTVQATTLPDLIHARNLQILNITTTSFNATWSRIFGDVGRYFLDYAPISDLRRRLRKTLYGDQTTVVVSGLAPNTTYQIIFIPESSLQYTQSQTIQVSTLPDLIQVRNLKAMNITPTGFHLTWLILPGDTGRYTVSYQSSSKPGVTTQMIHGESSVAIRGLSPNTSYKVTFTPVSRDQLSQSQTIQVSTFPDPLQQRNLRVLDITPTSFLVTWTRLPGDSGRYILEHSPVSEPRRKLQKSLSKDEDSVLIGGLSPDTIYSITLIPESNAPDVQQASIQVSTLPDVITSRNLHVRDKSSTSVHLSWSHLSGDTGKYIVEYAPLEDSAKTLQKTLYGKVTNVLLSSLTPNTTYRVTFTPESREPLSQSQAIQVATLPEVNHIRNLHAWDISTSSFRLAWPRLATDGERYVLEYSLVSDPRKKLRKHLSGEESSILISHLDPDTKYRATLYAESNVQHVPPQSIQISTLPDQVGLSQILISDPTSHSFRVSWGPHLDGVVGYEIQYEPLPSNAVETMQVDSRFNSTVIEGLKANTTYLVTVSAIFKSGGEKALSAIACTGTSGSKVKFLRIEDLQANSLQAVWGSADGDVQGYQVRCRRHARTSSVISVAPETHSVQLTDLPGGITNKICVKPVYKDGHGRSLCKKVHMQLATPANSYLSLQDRPKGT